MDFFFFFSIFTCLVDNECFAFVTDLEQDPWWFWQSEQTDNSQWCGYRAHNKERVPSAEVLLAVQDNVESYNESFKSSLTYILDEGACIYGEIFLLSY